MLRDFSSRITAPAMIHLRARPLLAFLLAFNGVYLATLVLRPFSEQAHVALGDLAQVIGPLAIVAAAVPALRSRWRDSSPAVRRSSTFLILGVASFVIGQSIWAFYELVLHRETPFPSLADVGFFAEYVFLFVGVLQLPTRPLPTVARVRIVLDSLMSMAALVTFSWYFILAPMLVGGRQSPLATALGFFYPLADLALLFCVLLLAGRRSLPGTRPALLFLCTGLCSIVIIDTAFAYGTLHRLYTTGSFLDVFWPLGYMLIALGGRQLLTMRTRTAAPEGAMPGPSMLQSLLPYLFLPPVIALLWFTHDAGGGNLRTAGVYAGAAAILFFMLARQFVVILENQLLYRQLQSTVAELTASHQQLTAANALLTTVATTDAMTGLANHRAFKDRLRHELARSSRSGQPLSLVLLDVDHFKAFNDNFGHLAGDEVLRLVAAALCTSLRTTDLAARYGGEEFAVLLPGAHADEALRVAERIQKALAKLSFAHRAVTLSAGVATSTAVCPVGPDTLIQWADVALYKSKADGRNRVTVSARTMANSNKLQAA
jgi:diguanylate cyclase (GGDEF)-like protein